MRRPQHRRALRGDGGRRAATSTTDERLARLLPRPLRLLRRRRRARTRCPRAVLLALGAGREQRRADRRRGRRRAPSGDGQLPAPGGARRRGRRRPRGRARSPLREGVIYEELPYDRAVHTPLFAPFAEELRAIFAGLPVRPPRRRCGRARPRRPTPTTRSRDPRAAGRALDQPGSTSARRSRRSTRTVRASSSRCGPRGNLTSFVEDILRGRRRVRVGRRRAPPLGDHAAEPPRRTARRPRRRARPRATCSSSAAREPIDWRAGAASRRGRGRPRERPAATTGRCCGSRTRRSRGCAGAVAQ